MLGHLSRPWKRRFEEGSHITHHKELVMHYVGLNATVSRRTEFAIRLGTFLFNIAFRCIRHGEHMQSHFGDSFLVTAGRLTTGSC